MGKLYDWLRNTKKSDNSKRDAAVQKNRVGRSKEKTLGEEIEELHIALKDAFNYGQELNDAIEEFAKNPTAENRQRADEAFEKRAKALKQLEQSMNH